MKAKLRLEWKKLGKKKGSKFGTMWWGRERVFFVVVEWLLHQVRHSLGLSLVGLMGKHLYWVVLFLPKFMAVSAAFAWFTRNIILGFTVLQAHLQFFFKAQRGMEEISLSPFKPYLPKFPQMALHCMTVSSTWT